MHSTTNYVGPRNLEDYEYADCLEEYWCAEEEGTLEISTGAELTFSPEQYALREKYFKILKTTPVAEFLSGTSRNPVCIIDYAKHNRRQQIFNASLIRYMWYYTRWVEFFVDLWEDGYDFESCAVGADLLFCQARPGGTHITFAFYNTGFSDAVPHFKCHYPQFKEDLEVRQTMYLEEGESLHSRPNISKENLLLAIGAERR